MQIFLKIKPIDFEAQSKQMDSLSICLLYTSDAADE